MSSSSPASDDSPIRVVVVDDHVLVREGLVLMLRQMPGIAVVAEAGDGEQALEVAHQHRPDIVLMDVHMPRVNGLDATARLQKELGHVRVIGLSMYEESEIAGAMRRVGAAAYLSKDCSADQLADTIRRVARVDARARDGDSHRL